ncbi:MAG: NADH-quinone oxidoreductase subunit C [Deltaproteobacteria bacterium]|nr:MAG: NADH-quinone oxidoreductase subunit C [Deltaproteobacteria bacterium]
MVQLSQILEGLKGSVEGAVLSSETFRGQDVIRVEASAIVDVMTYLRDNCSFDMLTDLTAVDYLGREKRFEMVYILYSFEHNRRLHVKATLADGEKIATIEGVWKAANWLEREVYDLLGIHFEGHSDLRRILLWDGYEGHPLRKDFPLKGIPQKTTYR